MLCTVDLFIDAVSLPRNLTESGLCDARDLLELFGVSVINFTLKNLIQL